MIDSKARAALVGALAVCAPTSNADPGLSSKLTARQRQVWPHGLSRSTGAGSAVQKGAGRRSKQNRRERETEGEREREEGRGSKKHLYKNLNAC